MSCMFLGRPREGTSPKVIGVIPGGHVASVAREMKKPARAGRKLRRDV